MKRASMFNKVLSVVLVISLLMAIAVPAMAADTAKVSFEKVDNSSVSAKLPGHNAAVDAEDAYADTDIVRVSIVMDKAGTIEAGFSPETVATNFFSKMYRNGLKRDQEKMVNKIEKATKQKLDVVWNLTLAANIISAYVPYGQIKTIEEISGVAAVLIETQYAPDVVESGAADPNMATSGKQIGSAPAWAAGYTGAGTRIAIIDTGADTDHQSFAAAAYEYALAYRAGLAGVSVEEYKASLDLLDAEEIAAVAADLNAPVTGADAYINSKIPFGYNYVDGNFDVTHDNDNQGSHGSHVAGIATANAYIPAGDEFVSALGSALVQGVAPDAQLITMKVFGKSGGAYDSDYMAAIEDAIVLGCDSVNLSLGSGNPGMSRNANEEYQAIMDSLVGSGVVVAMSAGNSGYWAEYDYNLGYLYADDVSMHTGGSPGSFVNSLGVASVDNDGVTGLYFTVGDAMVVYNETEYTNLPLATLAGENEFVMITGIGTAEDWAAVADVLEGKIALCFRGETSFYEKAVHAVEAGAIATIICNNQAGIINMDLSDYTYTEPAVSITLDDAMAIMSEATAVTDDEGNVLYYTGTMNIAESMGASQYNSPYYTMSVFSSWGVPGSLTMKPEITAPGGSIYSINGVDPSGTAYEVMSGTSMASPQVAGMAALMGQYIEENGLEALTGLDQRALAQSLLMSTAVPMLASASGYHSVLQQGAGLANVGAAIMADTYILMGADATASYADGKVKAELGDDPDRTGEYSFSFTINNMTDVEKLYNLSADFFIQAPTSDGVNMYMYTSTGLIGAITSFTVDGAEVTPVWGLDGLDFNGDGAVNTLDGQALLDYATGLRTELTNEDKADIDADGDIDSYDAYLFLAAAEAVTTVPASGSVEVTVNVTIPEDWKYTLDYYYPNGTYIQGYVYADGVSSEEGVMGTSHSIPVLGFFGNWSDPSMIDKGTRPEYMTGDETRAPYLGSANINTYVVNYAALGSAGYYFGGNPVIPDDTYMPERNAINAINGDFISTVQMGVIRNAAASRFTAVNETTGEVYVDAEMGQILSAYFHVNSGTWQNVYTQKKLNFVPAGAAEGDVLKLAVTLAPEYYVDAEGKVDWDALGDGATFSIEMVVDNTAPVLEDVAISIVNNTLDITASDNQYISSVTLYNKRGNTILAETGAKQDIEAGESAKFSLDLTGVNGNTFLVQVTDYAMNTTTYKLETQIGEEPELPEMIAFDMDWGYWTSFTKESDYDELDVYANASTTFCAATIVDHMVIAADIYGDLYVMPETDLEDTTLICNTGVIISDMAYNKVDGNVYGVVDGYLVIVDKLTGELTLVGEIGVLTNTLACDTMGTFYCNGYGTGNVYSFTLDTIAEPEIVVENIECDGDLLATSYLQTMEINPNTGMLCWNSYYGMTFGSWVLAYAYYIEVNPATGEYTVYNDLWDELAALIIPEKTSGGGSWTAPVDEATGIQISATQMNLLKGAQEVLSATVTPWTATDRTVSWTSSDETVATVDAKGVVTAVGAGTATITATSNLNPELTATCTVNVEALNVTINGTLQDAEGTSMFYSWNMETDNTWTGGNEIDTSMTSATYDKANDTYYIMDSISDVWAMHKVNPDGESVEVATNGAAVPLWDMQYSDYFSALAGQPMINSIYYYYYLAPKSPMNLDTAAFNLSTYASYLTAIASMGYEEFVDDEDGSVYDTEHVVLLTAEGYVIHFWVYLSETGFSAYIGRYQSDLPCEFPGDDSGENMYTSMVVGEDGALYVSTFNGDTNELFRLTYDEYDMMYKSVRIGDVGEDVWPATITEVTVNGEAEADAIAMPKATEKIDAVTVTAEEMAAAAEAMTAVNNMNKAAQSSKSAKAQLNTEKEQPNTESAQLNAAEVEETEGDVVFEPIQLKAGAVVDAGEDTVTITITAQDVYTNGVATVTYDADALTLVDVVMGADYTSVNPGEGTVTVGFVQLDGYAADDVVATLIFEVKSTDSESVTVTYDEINNEHPETEEDVEIEYPHANTEVKDAKDATCTEDGYTGDTYCADCGKLLAKGEVIPATGHGETEIKDAKDATCTEEGYTGDTYCTDCGEKIADGEAIDALGHKYESVVTKPTVDAEGYTTHTCTECGHSYVDSYVPKVDPENPKTSQDHRTALLAGLAVMTAAAAAVVVMLGSKKKLF